MNRRDFTRSLLAAAALPVIPTPALAAAPAALPSAATSWASYLTAMHGTCTPKMLSSLLSVDLAAAQGLTRGLVARGVLSQSQTVSAMPIQAMLKSHAKTRLSLRSSAMDVINQIDKPDTKPETQPTTTPCSKTPSDP